MGVLDEGRVGARCADDFRVCLFQAAYWNAPLLEEPRVKCEHLKSACLTVEVERLDLLGVGGFGRICCLCQITFRFGASVLRLIDQVKGSLAIRSLLFVESMESYMVEHVQRLRLRFV